MLHYCCMRAPFTQCAVQVLKLENSEAKVYYTIVEKAMDNMPSSAEVKAGQQKGGQAAKASGYIETSTPTKEYTKEVDGLLDGTDYDVFFLLTNWITETVTMVSVATP